MTDAATLPSKAATTTPSKATQQSSKLPAVNEVDDEEAITDLQNEKSFFEKSFVTNNNAAGESEAPLEKSFLEQSFMEKSFMEQQLSIIFIFKIFKIPVYNSGLPKLYFLNVFKNFFSYIF